MTSATGANSRGQTIRATRCASFAASVCDVRLVRLGSADAERLSDHWVGLRQLILSHDEAYPRIGNWLERKVRPGLAAGKRAVFVAYADEIPAGTVVVKHGSDAKICHLSVTPGLRRSNLGEFLFALGAIEAQQAAKRLHFTLPEGLWDSEAGFFHSFNFPEAVPFGKQYRFFERELRCSAPMKNVLSASLTKLVKLRHSLAIDGYDGQSRLVMSVQPVWAAKLMTGEKTVEVRRAFSTRWESVRCAVYAAAPRKELVGDVMLERVVVDTPQVIWNRFGSRMGCHRADFEAYCRGAKRVYALELSDPRPLRPGISLSRLRRVFGEKLRPPQSYSAVTTDSSWGAAVPMAALLQGHLDGAEPILPF